MTHYTINIPPSEDAPIVLLHGWGMSPDVWQVLSPLISAKRVICLALPGHGGVPYKEGEDWVDYLVGKVPEAAHWIGWSLGGVLALQLARRYPKQVKSLYLIGASPCFTQRDDWECATAPHTFSDFSKQLEKHYVTTLKRFWSLQFIGTKMTEDAKQLRNQILQTPPDYEALQYGLHLLQTVDLRASLSTIKVPQLWCVGDKDRLVPEAMLNQLALLYTNTGQSPNVKTELLQGGGHAPFLNHPERIAESINCWLRNHAL